MIAWIGPRPGPKQRTKLRPYRPEPSEAATRCHLFVIHEAIDGYGVGVARHPGSRTFPSSTIFGKVAGVKPYKLRGSASSGVRSRTSSSGKSPDGTWWQLRYLWAIKRTGWASVPS